MAKKLTKKELAEIKKYHQKFPRILHIKLVPSGNGYTFFLKEFPRAVSQTEIDLIRFIEMASDCVATILEVPKKYLFYMPKYLPTMELAERFCVLPDRNKKGIKEGKLSMVAV